MSFPCISRLNRRQAKTQRDHEIGGCSNRPAERSHRLFGPAVKELIRRSRLAAGRQIAGSGAGFGQQAGQDDRHEPVEQSRVVAAVLGRRDQSVRHSLQVAAGEVSSRNPRSLRSFQQRVGRLADDGLADRQDR